MRNAKRRLPCPDNLRSSPAPQPALDLSLATLRGQDYDLLIAADEPEIETAAPSLRNEGKVEPFGGSGRSCDRRRRRQALCGVKGRQVDCTVGECRARSWPCVPGPGFGTARRVVDTNVTGTIYLIHKVATICAAGRRILIVGSIAGFTPGSFQAVYNGTKAFLNSFSFALREELKDTKVTVTCLMPGATETEFFGRADMMDTAVGTAEKDDPAEVANNGFDAMIKGEGDVVSGFKNKVQSAAANVTPAELLASQHRKKAEPGTARS